MLDMIVRNEMDPNIVQISGGEPTLHPQFFDILDAAKAAAHQAHDGKHERRAYRPGRNVCSTLGNLMPNFDIYLQFDSLKPHPLMQLRGADLCNALERLNDMGVSTTLVVTVERGVNDGELDAIVEFALRQPCVRHDLSTCATSWPA